MVVPPRLSAGLLLCRANGPRWEFLLAHPGGPFFAKKDDGAWSLPKGLIDPDEDPLAAARREFSEETGLTTPDGPYQALGEVVQKGGKRVRAWAFVADPDLTRFCSNTFELEWPPRSGKRKRFPEVDRVAFFAFDAARLKLLEAQHAFLVRAQAWLSGQAP
ncbi:MAG TPA: NUDIX domain-containing protein [Polyangiales bacterium]